jgi:hypothetical protein
VTTQTLTRPSGGVVTRQMNHEEARNYYITVAGDASGTARVKLPLDVRGLCVGGPYFTVWNLGGGDLIVLKGTDTVATVAVGKSVQLYLTDASTATGTWKALDTGGSNKGVTSGARTFLS